MSADLSSTAGRIGTDLILLVAAAIACAGLVALTRVLRAREARTAPAADGPDGNSGFGLIFVAMGLMLTSFVLYGAIHADPFTADHLMGLPAGLMFVFAGILLSIPPQDKIWRNLLGTLVITCFALTLDWVAFAPGERKFTGSIGGIGFIPDEMLGRALFGICAILLDLGAIAMDRTVPARIRTQASEEKGSPTTRPVPSPARRARTCS